MNQPPNIIREYSYLTLIRDECAQNGTPLPLEVAERLDSIESSAQTMPRYMRSQAAAEVEKYRKSIRTEIEAHKINHARDVAFRQMTHKTGMNPDAHSGLTESEMTRALRGEKLRTPTRSGLVKKSKKGLDEIARGATRELTRDGKGLGLKDAYQTYNEIEAGWKDGGAAWQNSQKRYPNISEERLEKLAKNWSRDGLAAMMDVRMSEKYGTEDGMVDVQVDDSDERKASIMKGLLDDAERRRDGRLVEQLVGDVDSRILEEDSRAGDIARAMETVEEREVVEADLDDRYGTDR